MKRTRLIAALPVLGAFAIAGTPAASAQIATDAASSGNWSGYVVGDGSSSYSSVSGSWVQPSVTCNSGETDSAYWVGLGGASGGSGALEQTGTEANCSAGGSAINYAWYELVPAAPVQLPVAIHAGDHVTGRVTVNGSTVTVTIDDTTTGQSSTKTLTMQNPDTSTAEWIAEAPSVCEGGAASGQCQPLPLADFGTVAFSNATATSGGHTGTISDPAWSSEPVALTPQTQTSTAGADPSTLSPDGASFTVGYNSGGTEPYGGYNPYAGYGYNPYAGYGGYNPYGAYNPYNPYSSLYTLITLLG